MKNLAICLLLLLGAVGCGDDYVVYETVDTMVCIPKNDFQVLEYDAASGKRAFTISIFTRAVTMTTESP